jgi:hypothetical protein
MSFLSPWFLAAGLAALALPLWLHLLERQNPVRIPFSSLMFFERDTERSVRRRHLKYLALLAARLALLGLVAVLFARPVWRRPVMASSEGPRARIIAVDTSFSMSYGDRWKRAQSEALTLVDGVRSGDRAQVIAFGPGVRVMNDPTDDRSLLRSAVNRLKPTMSRNSYGELGQSLRTLSQNTAAAGNLSAPGNAAALEVHIISDFQQSAMPGRFADLSLPQNATLQVHSVATGGSQNWCVESVKGETHLYEKGKPRIEVTVAGFGTPAANRRVWLTINGRQAASQTVAVPQSGRATVEFSDFDVPYGHSRGEVRIDSADPMPGDDVRLVSFERADPLPILFLHQPGKTREMLYYGTALEASGQPMFTMQAMSPVEAGGAPLERYAFVVLCDVPRLPAILEQRLKSFLEAGGAALLIVGPSIALENTAPLISGRITDVRYTPRDRERFQQISDADLSHPALRGSQRFAGVKVFEYARWEAPRATVLARLADGSPFLLEEAIGAGRLLALSSSIDNIWNDLPVSPLFVPFVAESAHYLSGAEETVTQATVDSSLELEKRRDPRSSVEVLDPSGRRALSLAAAVSSRELFLSSAGFYEVRRPGKVELVAVNPDPRESDLRPISEETLALWKSTGRPQAAAQPGAAAAPGAPRDIWRGILLLALLAAVLESVLGNLHLGAGPEAPSQ